MNKVSAIPLPVSRRGKAPELRILLVDEDASDLKFHLEALEHAGHDVVACDSYDGAARLVERGNFDFAIVTQGGPEFEGHVVLERIAEQARFTPVLVLTRCADMRAYIEAMQMGAIDYLEKSPDPSELVGIVKRHVPRARVAARSSHEVAG